MSANRINSRGKASVDIVASLNLDEMRTNIPNPATRIKGDRKKQESGIPEKIDLSKRCETAKRFHSSGNFSND